MTLGKRIARARKRLKLTQQQVGDAMGVSDKAVSAWERTSEIERDRIPELRKILKVTYVWLLEGAGDPPAPDNPLVALDDLPEDQQEAVAAYIQLLRQRSGRAA